MIFKNTSPLLLKQIDEFLVLSYPFLSHEDELYYLGEFTPRELASYSDSNRLILNYKKSIDRKDYPDWIYKEQAIKQAASLFHRSISQTSAVFKRMNQALLVPIPPSEAQNSPKYDDRNVRMLRHFASQTKIAELLVQKESRPSLRTMAVRNPKILENNYSLNPIKLDLNIREIWLFDDVLTQGTTFRAASNTIKRTYPQSKVVGFFIARSVYSQ